MNINDSELSAPEPSSDPIQEATARFKEEARLLSEGYPSVLLRTMADKGLKAAVSPGAFKAYVDSVLAETGNPKDPLERMLVEQSVFAHFRIGALHVEAANAKSPEAAAALSTAATKLMAEMRKHALGLREYRAPVVPKQVTVVKQQNVAAGNQNVAQINGKATSESMPDKTSRSELAGNQGRLSYVEFNDPFNVIAEADCGTAEPVAKQRHYERGAEKAPGISQEEPSLGALDGSEVSKR
jgi:hypothetical protein